MSEQTSLQKAPPGPPEVPSTITIPAYTVEQRDGGETLSLLEYWRMLRKRRWTVLSILLLVVVTVMIGSLKETPVYRAKAVMQIDRENSNILSFKEAFQIDTSEDDYLETAYRNLESRSLAYRVIQKLKLDQVPEFAGNPSQKRSWFSQIWKKLPPSNGRLSAGEVQLDPKYERIIDNFLDRLTVTPVRRSRLVAISFDSYDPALSAQVVN